jgi:DNA-binding NarL/FixJ family response regulator
VRVVLADDNLLLREGVARVLAEAGFTVAGQCGTAAELVRAVDAQPPDVAIVDIRMPPTYTDEGLQAAREIRARHPQVGVLVLSQYVELGLAMQLLAGSIEGVGYLLKDRVGDLAEFAAAVRRVGAGGSAVDPEIVCQLLRRRGAEPVATLTAREREVLELMAEGRSNQGIADRLAVTERAVQKHITSIFAKLGLDERGDDHRRVLAVLAFLRAHPVG